jgi:hypothetical protein
MSVNVWLSSEFEGQHGDARQSVAVSLLVFGHSSAELDEEKFLGERVATPVGTQYLYPIWAMLHKLRQVMGMRNARYQLAEMVELDEDFFSTEMEENEKDKPLKRGRGSQKKSKVLVIAESVPVEGGSKSKDGKPRKVGHIKMFVIEDLKTSTIDEKVIENMDKQSIIDSDSSTSYTNFKTLVREHRPKVIPKNEVAKLLP